MTRTPQPTPSMRVGHTLAATLLLHGCHLAAPYTSSGVHVGTTPTDASTIERGATTDSSGGDGTRSLDGATDARLKFDTASSVDARLATDGSVDAANTLPELDAAAPDAPLADTQADSCAAAPCTPLIYLFRGDAKSGALGGRAGVDTICRDTKQLRYSQLPTTEVRAFISVDPADEVRDMPDNYGIPLLLPIVGPSGIKVADSWADLLDGTIDETLLRAEVYTTGAGTWYSGTTANGALAPENCSGWTSADGFLDGRGGFYSALDASWISSRNLTCGDGTSSVICISYD